MGSQKLVWLGTCRLKEHTELQPFSLQGVKLQDGKKTSSLVPPLVVGDDIPPHFSAKI